MTGATLPNAAGASLGLDPRPIPYALGHALAYASMGMPVLALTPGGKKPAGGHGFKDATRDPDIIRGWFTAMPGAGVGICPGPGRLLVLDIDDKNGKDGLASLARLQDTHGVLPETLRQKTPHGRGHHLFYRVPEGWAVGNASPWPGIDVRSTGGYVVAEPTQLDDTAVRYAFDDWDVTTGEIPEIADAPVWLLALLTSPAKPDLPAATGEAASERASGETVAELRSALNMLNPNDYHVWISSGLALKRLGLVGRGLWMDWSQQSPKFNPRDAADKWAGFAPEHTGYAAVFKAAQAAGWVNPASRAAGASTGPPGSLPDPAASGLGLLEGQVASNEAVASFVEVDLARVHDVVPQGWWWGHYLPASQTTLLSAHGGTGKSMLGLMLAVCIALGLLFLGQPTKQGRVLYFSGEDPADVVMRRLSKIITDLGLDAEQLRANLRVIDATEGDPALFRAQRTGGVTTGEPTTSYAELSRYISEHQIDVLIADNASDVFEGDEISRPMVRKFIRLLTRLVRPRAGAVLLLAHVDKGTSRAGKAPIDTEGYSGSTAWHNSVRSRLFMREMGDGRLEVQHQKSNLGAKHPPLVLAWDAGSLPKLASTAAASSPEADAKGHANMLSLVALIHEYYSRGEWVATSLHSPSNAAKLLKAEPTFPKGLTSTAATALLREAHRQKLVLPEQYQSVDRKHRERWSVTEIGCTLIGAAPSAPSTAPST